MFQRVTQELYQTLAGSVCSSTRGYIRNTPIRCSGRSWKPHNHTGDGEQRTRSTDSSPPNSTPFLSSCSCLPSGNSSCSAAISPRTNPYASQITSPGDENVPGPRVHSFSEECKTLARSHGRHARLHFLWGDVFDVGANRPLVAERIQKSS